LKKIDKEVILSVGSSLSISKWHDITVLSTEGRKKSKFLLVFIPFKSNTMDYCLRKGIFEVNPSPIIWNGISLV